MAGRFRPATPNQPALGRLAEDHRGHRDLVVFLLDHGHRSSQMARSRWVGGWGELFCFVWGLGLAWGDGCLGLGGGSV